MDKALSRNCKSGSIRRVGCGLYHQPRNHPALGFLGPSYDAMQDLIQRKAGGDVFPTGAHSANVLGLSDQVPMRSWHLTTGPNRRIRSGKSEIVLRHVSPRFVSTKNPKSAQVIFALRWIGRRGVDNDVISKLRRNLSQADPTARPFPLMPPVLPPGLPKYSAVLPKTRLPPDPWMPFPKLTPAY